MVILLCITDRVGRLLLTCSFLRLVPGRSNSSFVGFSIGPALYLVGSGNFGSYFCMGFIMGFCG